MIENVNTNVPIRSDHFILCVHLSRELVKWSPSNTYFGMWEIQLGKHGTLLSWSLIRWRKIYIPILPCTNHSPLFCSKV